MTVQLRSVPPVPPFSHVYLCVYLNEKNPGRTAFYRDFSGGKRGIWESLLRKASRAWGIVPARRSPENLSLAAFLHGDHPFRFESPAKSFLNEKNPQASQLTDFSGGKRGIRTLGGFMAHTRFPVVRLRPAQPSFHVFFAALNGACISYRIFRRLSTPEVQIFNKKSRTGETSPPGAGRE